MLPPFPKLSEELSDEFNDRQFREKLSDLSREELEDMCEGLNRLLRAKERLCKHLIMEFVRQDIPKEMKS